MSRSCSLVLSGFFILFGLYAVQACILVNFLAEKISGWCWFCVLLFLPALIFTIIYVCCRSSAYAEIDKEARYVWAIWNTYIMMAFTPLVAGIFFKVVDNLDHDDRFGPNALKGVLCITPALLILLLHLTIDPSYRKSILTVSVLAALNMFDAIEMLEIVLVQRERDDFNLNIRLERSIIVFACIGFLITSIGLARNKLCDDDTNTKERTCTSIVLGILEIIATNLPFLILRVIVWVDCGYEASIFIAKNMISLVIGVVEIFILGKCCKCG